MAGRILLTAITIMAMVAFATWYWVPFTHEDAPIGIVADRESAAECLKGDVEVTASLLNVRAIPVNGNVIAQFGKGTRLKALRCAANWADITASGWVHADYLRPVPGGRPTYVRSHGAMASDNPPPSRPTGVSNCGTGYRQVSAGRLNLRAEPVDGVVTGRLAVGTGVTVSRCDGDWAQASVAGWVHTHYLSPATYGTGHPKSRR